MFALRDPKTGTMKMDRNFRKALHWCWELGVGLGAKGDRRRPWGKSPSRKAKVEE